MQTPSRFTIVGAGLGGVITACRLARDGAHVTVVDGADVDHLGGRARSLELGGLPINTGPRALYRGLALDSALRELGVQPAGFAPPTAGGLVLREGTLHLLPSSLSSLLSTPLLRGGARKETALILARLTIGAFDVHAGESIGAWIDRHAQTADARAIVALLARVATYAPVGFDDVVGNDIDALTVLTNIRAAATKGVRYVDGGWSSLVSALLARAKSLGVDVIANAGAERVADGSVTLRDGRVLHSDAVVVATPPQAAASLLSRTFATNALHAACLDLVVERLPRPEHRFVLGIDRPLYFSVHTPPSSSGPVIVHVAAYGGGVSRDELEAFVDVVQPGWRAHLRAARFLPKMPVMHDVPRAGQRRVDTVVDDRTLLVGDWVEGPGLLADASAASALRATTLLSTSSMSTTTARAA